LLPNILLHCWQLNCLFFLAEGKFCSLAFSAIALEPSHPFLKIWK
jgi:hypothetical protein